MGDMFWKIDWRGIFTPQNSLLEMVVRGTIMYFVLFVLMRFVLKRQAGGIGTTDVGYFCITPRKGIFQIRVIH